MRLHFLLALVSLLALALAWTKEDYEIFDLVSDLEAAEGKGTSFYSHLGIESSASHSEISKAYRKRSLELHPDKNPGVKDIHERFVRLGVIAQILRSTEGRERYNFFYKNGVPKWRGTGYYYSRYRPTLSHTLMFLVLITAGGHRLVMQLNYNRDRRRVAYFEKSARVAAGVSKRDGEAGDGGNKNGNGTENGGKAARRRKVKVPMVEGMEQAGYLELIVKGEHVYLPHPDGTLTPLSTLATPPSFLRTWPFTLTLSLLRRGIAFLPISLQSRIPASFQPALPTEEVSEEDDDSSPEGTPTPPPRNRRGRASELNQQSRTVTPKDSPATTEVESDGEGGMEGEGKKKRRGAGKAAGMRRRKMGMKK